MTEKSLPVLMPSEVSSRIGFFDRFAGLAARLASRAPFFAFCLLLVIIWLVQGVTLIVSKGSLNAFLDSQYQLEINTHDDNRHLPDGRAPAEQPRIRRAFRARGLRDTGQGNDGSGQEGRCVMAGTSKQVKGKANKLAGSAKKAVGKATKDRSLQAKGSVQKAKGTVQDVAGKVERKVRGSGKS